MDSDSKPNVEKPATSALPPTREYMQRIEEQAAQLRQRAKVGPMERFDPREVADSLDLSIVEPADINAMSADGLAQVEAISPKTWSGSGLPLPDGKLLVLLNPSQTPERANITMLEEAAHEHLGHEPTLIDTASFPIASRNYNARNEQDAYWTAAAALLPSKVVAQAVYRGLPAYELATAYGVSVELVEFRIKTLGLWRHYRKRAASRGA